MSSNADDHSERQHLIYRLFDKVIGKGFELVLQGLSLGAKQLPWAKRRLRSIQVSKGYQYGPLSDWHTLDIYAPLNRSISTQEQISREHGAVSEDSTKSDVLPFVLYLHGGGFRICSKETHWPFGVRFAEEGFMVFVVNYRLAPAHPCPAGLEDCVLALEWILDHAEQLGIDPKQGMIAGESAGGNLTLATTLCTLREDDEPWAKRLYQRGWVPQMIAPACAFLDVSGSGRDPKEMSALAMSRVKSLGRGYLRGSTVPHLGDPLAELVQGCHLDRPCPPVLITVGDRDPVERDSHRLADELERRSIPHRLMIYSGGIHSFHAAIHRPLAEECWRDHFDYWEEVNRGDTSREVR